jgi:hypothetical protein
MTRLPGCAPAAPHGACCGRTARRAGILLGRSGSSDAIDAALVCLSRDGDGILTSDPDDLFELARAAGVHVELIPV